MAKIPLRLDEIVDGEVLRRDLSALAEKGDGDSAKVRAAVVRPPTSDEMAGKSMVSATSNK